MTVTTQPTTGVPSRFPHPVYKVQKWHDSYGGTHLDHVRVGHTPGAVPDDAQVVSSQIDGTREHTIMLDLDLPATLLPSSTPGHWHLYVDHALPWRKYKRLLRALARAGVIETGYYRASVHRKGTHLRLPDVRKARP